MGHILGFMNKKDLHYCVSVCHEWKKVIGSMPPVFLSVELSASLPLSLVSGSALGRHVSELDCWDAQDCHESLCLRVIHHEMPAVKDLTIQLLRISLLRCFIFLIVSHKEGVSVLSSVWDHQK